MNVRTAKENRLSADGSPETFPHQLGLFGVLVFATFWVVFIGANRAFAQNPALPANPSGTISPLVPPSQNPTLRTTTVQSTQPVYNPNQLVTADEYYKMLGTTGSHQVNVSRAKADQEAAVQAAQRRKKFIEEAASVRHYRLPGDSASSREYMQSNRPHPNPAPIAAPAPTMPISRSTTTSRRVPQGTLYSENAGSTPGEIEYIDMSGGPNLAQRFQGIINRTKKPSTEPLPNPYVEEPSLPPAPAAPVAEVSPPQVTVTAPVPQFPPPNTSPASPEPPQKKKLFSRFRKKPAPAYQPLPTAPAPAPAATPEPRNIFRPNIMTQNVNQNSLIKGRNAIALVDGQEIKLSPGTRVKVLRTGTDRSLIKLYDNREATIANSALTPE